MFDRQPFSSFAPLLASGVIIVTLLPANPTVGQDASELRATYGRGVHAYFAGQVAQAEQLFSQAVEAGSTDPRLYYFRSMARLRLGRQFEAEDDMRVGSALEAQNPGSQGLIGKSL